MSTSAETSSLQTPAKVNADFKQRVVVDTNKLPWLHSPQPGVERRLLDRIGEEVARATSLVRYAADSHFPPHNHGGGEEFFVLAGTFCDEHGSYPQGTYVRNPPGSSHTPFTEEGCTILVKLRQMESDNAPRVVVHTKALPWSQQLEGGAQEKLLFDAIGERVALIQVPAGSEFTTPSDSGGEELFVLSGALTVADAKHSTGHWTRTPPGHSQCWHAVENALCWVKRGHLRGAGA